MRKILLPLLLAFLARSAMALPYGLDVEAGLYYSSLAPTFLYPVYSYDPDTGERLMFEYDYYPVLPLSAIVSCGKGLFSFGILASEFLHADGSAPAYISCLEVTPFAALSSRNMLFGAVDIEVGMGLDLGFMYASIPGYVNYDLDLNGMYVNAVNWGFTHFIRVDIRIFKGLEISIMMKNRSIFTDNRNYQIGSFDILPLYNFGLSYAFE